MFVVHLSLHDAMQNRTFFHMCHSHSHDVIPIPIPISSQKATPIPMRLPWESHSHEIVMGIPVPRECLSHAHLQTTATGAHSTPPLPPLFEIPDEPVHDVCMLGRSYSVELWRNLRRHSVTVMTAIIIWSIGHGQLSVESWLIDISSSWLLYINFISTAFRLTGSVKYATKYN